MDSLAWLVRHRGADRVPHATDLLAHDGQRADHRDADEDQDETVLRLSLARLATREPLHHDHPLHPRDAQRGNDGRNGPFRYGRLRPHAPAESASSLRGCPARRPPAWSAL